MPRGASPSLSQLLAALEGNIALLSSPHPPRPVSAPKSPLSASPELAALEDVDLALDLVLLLHHQVLEDGDEVAFRLIRRLDARPEATTTRQRRNTNNRTGRECVLEHITQKRHETGVHLSDCDDQGVCLRHLVKARTF